MKFSTVAVALLLSLAAALQVSAEPSPEAALAALYDAGAKSDATAFVSLLTEDAVVLGLDGENRLQGQALRDFISASFAQGKSWSYRSSARQTQLSADGAVAWFDEILEQESAHGRSSGVLVRTGEGWKIAQYNVTLPLANVAVTTQEPPPPAKKRCNKISHKTNTQASC
jgi:ketosteroid isomerase-like protein